MNISTQFRHLPVGATFDWRDEDHPHWNSFGDRCVKLSQRRYRSLETGLMFQVGSINAMAHHIETLEKAK